jgi:hypothetical protein
MLAPCQNINHTDTLRAQLTLSCDHAVLEKLRRRI